VRGASISASTVFPAAGVSHVGYISAGCGLMGLPVATVAVDELLPTEWCHHELKAVLFQVVTTETHTDHPDTDHCPEDNQCPALKVLWSSMFGLLMVSVGPH